MSRGIFETLLGALVLIVAVGFAGKLFFANEDTVIESYELTMRFGSVQGLKEAADVRLGGVRIGQIDHISLDETTLEAIVHIQIDSAIQLPTDSTAEITSAGLLGNSFLHIIPGTASARLAEGGEISKTSDPLSLEDMLGQAIFTLSQK